MLTATSPGGLTASNSAGPNQGKVSAGDIDNFGNEQFLLQKTATLGALNSGPQESPVVISEIMYHPPDLAYWSNVDDEFVELQNASTVPVPLYDSARPTNSWRIRGGVEFNFPPNTSLPPGGRLLVIGFDPVSDPPRLDSLRRRAGWD